MDEKQHVLRVLRALLLSNGKKDGTPLRELKYDYCATEGKTEIPCFEHKSVIDFLISSGEFILDIQSSGLVTVREKPKSMSSHLKKLIIEQRYSSAVNANGHRNNDLELASEYRPKLLKRNSLANLGSHLNAHWLFSERNEPQNASMRMPLMTPPTTPPLLPATVREHSEDDFKFMKSFDQELAEGYARDKGESLASQTITGKSVQSLSGTNTNASNMKDNPSTETAFDKLNRMGIKFHKTVICDAENCYHTILQIESVRYFGKGKITDEANENAARKYFRSVDSGTHQKLVKVPNSSFVELNEMYPVLNCQTIVRRYERKMFKICIQVDSINYYGNGRTLQSAANHAAETCFQSMKNGIHQVTLNPNLLQLKLDS